MDNLIDIKVVTTPKEYTDAMYVRRSVFVDEQNIKASLEFDGNDFSATHLVAYFDENPVGAMRIRYFKDFIKIERLCVVPKMRKTNVSDLLIASALDFVAQKGYTKAHCLCKKELLGRWAKAGFFPIEGAQQILQNGMTLIPIEKQIDLPLEHIDIKTSPYILNQIEGTWFEDKQINRATELVRKERLQRLENLHEKVRMFKVAPNKVLTNWHPPMKIDTIDSCVI